MEILIIGNDNIEVIREIEELISGHDIELHVINDMSDISPVLAMPPGFDRSEKLFGKGIKGFIEQNIILVDKLPSPWDDFTKGIKIKFKNECVDIKAACEPNPFHFSGYEHTFGKRLYIKRQEDIDNTKNLSLKHNKLVQRNLLKTKPTICRKHGVDNRR